MLPAFRWHDIHQSPADPLLECRRNLTVRERIPKHHNVVEIDALTHAISHRDILISIRNPARLEELSETQGHQRAITERCQRGGHVLHVEGADPLCQAYRRMGCGIVVCQGELPCLALDGIYHRLGWILEGVAELV